MSRSLRGLLACFLLLTGCPSQAPPPTEDAYPSVEIETEEQKTLYALGASLSNDMKNGLRPFSLNEEELSYVLQGVSDNVRGRGLQVNLLEHSVRLQLFAKERMDAAAASEEQASAAFLEEQAASADVHKHPSGLLFTLISEGEGASPDGDDRVEVSFTGTTRDGQVFDSSQGKGPARMSLAQAIPCWREGLQLLKEGGQIRLVCPPELAYGADGFPPVILPNAVLIFEIELLGVESFETPGEPAE